MINEEATNTGTNVFHMDTGSYRWGQLFLILLYDNEVETTLPCPLKKKKKKKTFAMAVVMWSTDRCEQVLQEMSTKINWVNDKNQHPKKVKSKHVQD